MRMTEKVARNVGILRRELAGKHPSLVESVVQEALPSQKLTLSHIDITIHDVVRYIDDEKKAERLYRTESQNPVIREIGATNIFEEIADDEKDHAQKLEALLPKLGEKWEEIRRKLV